MEFVDNITRGSRQQIQTRSKKCRLLLTKSNKGPCLHDFLSSRGSGFIGLNVIEELLSSSEQSHLFR